MSVRPMGTADLSHVAGPSGAAALLEIAGLGYEYPRPRTEALRDVTLAVHEGEFVSVVGPSGCGKSTLLAAVAGLLAGYQGWVGLRGEQIRRPHPQIGVVFQLDSTFPWRTARRNVEFGRMLTPRGRHSRRSCRPNPRRVYSSEGSARLRCLTTGFPRPFTW